MRWRTRLSRGLMLGDSEGALEPLERLIAVLGKDSSFAAGAWAEGLAAAGRRDDARAALAARVTPER